MYAHVGLVSTGKPVHGRCGAYSAIVGSCDGVGFLTLNGCCAIGPPFLYLKKKRMFSHTI